MHTTTPTGWRLATPPMRPPGARAVVGDTLGSIGIDSSSAMPLA